MEMINAQQVDLERRSQEAKIAVTFAKELMEEGSDIENLMFVNILMNRFKQCKKTDKSLQFTIKDSLHFLPDEKAPSNQAQNHIPLYGIITTQKASPKYSTLLYDGLYNLRVHKKAELVLLTKDNDDRQMCHGGLKIECSLRYKDSSMRHIPAYVMDKRDGTYIISFVPDAQGFLLLAIAIQGKSIEVIDYRVVKFPHFHSTVEWKLNRRNMKT